MSYQIYSQRGNLLIHFFPHVPARLLHIAMFIGPKREALDGCRTAEYHYSKRLIWHVTIPINYYYSQSRTTGPMEYLETTVKASLLTR